MAEVNTTTEQTVKMPVEEASMTVPALNNFVVSLIKPLRDARIRVIRHLTNKLKTTRTSKKPSEVVEKKSNNLLEEIKEIKALKLNNDVVKKLLAKQVNEKDLSKATSPADRAVMRLALEKSQFTSLVLKFRQEHADWIALTEFMLAKHGGRRFRRKNAKVSTEKLAKATLDVADKRAREQYASNDQRHQRNKRATTVKLDDDPGVEGSEIQPNSDAIKNEIEQSSSEVKAKPQTTWLSSIFSVETTNGQGKEEVVKTDDQPAPKDPKYQRAGEKDAEEGIVVKLDPEMLNKPASEGATLVLPVEGIFRKRKAEPESISSKKSEETAHAEKDSEEQADFFMPLDESGNDEISRSVGNVLKLPEIVDDSESTGRNRYNRGRGGFQPSRQFGQQRFQPNSFHGRGGARNAGPPKVEEKLHASWEARRQERNQQKLHIAPAGQAAPKKHITFGDDD